MDNMIYSIRDKLSTIKSALYLVITGIPTLFILLSKIIISVDEMIDEFMTIMKLVKGGIDMLVSKRTGVDGESGVDSSLLLRDLIV